MEGGAVSMKHTPGPWELELIQEWPFGVRIAAGDRIILQQSASANSSAQKTRKDCENGVGFKWHREDSFATREQAQAYIAEQDANARLIAAAPELLESLKWAMQEIPKYSQRVKGQNERYCDKWDAAHAAIAKAEGVAPATAPASADDTSRDAKTKE